MACSSRTSGQRAPQCRVRRRIASGMTDRADALEPLRGNGPHRRHQNQKRRLKRRPKRDSRVEVQLRQLGDLSRRLHAVRSEASRHGAGAALQVLGCARPIPCAPAKKKKKNGIVALKEEGIRFGVSMRHLCARAPGPRRPRCGRPARVCAPAPRPPAATACATAPAGRPPHLRKAQSTQRSCRRGPATAHPPGWSFSRRWAAVSKSCWTSRNIWFSSPPDHPPPQELHEWSPPLEG